MMNWSEVFRMAGRTRIFQSLLNAKNGKTLQALRDLPMCGENYGTLDQFEGELQDMVAMGLIYRDAFSIYHAKATASEFCSKTGVSLANFDFSIK